LGSSGYCFGHLRKKLTFRVSFNFLKTLLLKFSPNLLIWAYGISTLVQHTAIFSEAIKNRRSLFKENRKKPAGCFQTTARRFKPLSYGGM